MCCFFPAIEDVCNTEIFARSSTGALQFLVYQMHVKIHQDVAMVLPLPTAPGSPLRFINLEAYPNFFDDMRRAFPTKRQATNSVPYENLRSFVPVIDVGSFVASFLPTMADFERIDPRFRVPQGVWDKLPQYADYGFAVFQLKSGDRTIHPMAFEFERRDPSKLFFPTVHVHDGEVHPKAAFDHTLYCQGQPKDGWQMSDVVGGLCMRGSRSGGVVDLGERLYRFVMRGELANEDVMV